MINLLYPNGLQTWSPFWFFITVINMNVTFEKNDGKEEWMTPPYVVEALNTKFDLDPCSEEGSFARFADKVYTKKDNGLIQSWSGRVWCNPPYGNKAGDFLKKLKEHGNGIALIFARTETRVWFDHIWNDATALFFIKGRLAFYTKEGKKGGSAGSPSVLVAYGKENAELLKNCNLDGKYVELKKDNDK